MATKRQGDSCYEKAGMDEPIFVLRAQDGSAPETILYWLTQNPCLPTAKREEALLCYMAMKRWPTTKIAD